MFALKGFLENALCNCSDEYLVPQQFSLFVS